MFTPADWEDDVPESATHFEQVKKKKKAKLEIKTGKIKKTKIKHQSNKNNVLKKNCVDNLSLNSKPSTTETNKRLNHNDKTILNSTVSLSSNRPDRKANSQKNKNKKTKSSHELDDEEIDTKLILDKKRKLYGDVKSEEIEEMLFDRKIKKKEKIKNILETHLQRREIKPNTGSSLRQRMLERLRAARFRYLNEKLYLSESKEAVELFKNDPESFDIYHQGFKQQVKKWPINPLEVIIKSICKMPKDAQVVDMGCGEGALARRVPQSVRSFDLVSAAPHVEACDMARTPLPDATADVAVYCLALMGTNMKDYFVEANRILKVGGLMKIAEVESRIRQVEQFVASVERFGFSLARKDLTHQLFYFFDFRKERHLGNNTKKLPNITLDPCLYKKR